LPRNSTIHHGHKVCRTTNGTNPLALHVVSLVMFGPGTDKEIILKVIIAPTINVVNRLIGLKKSLVMSFHRKNVLINPPASERAGVLRHQS